MIRLFVPLAVSQSEQAIASGNEQGRYYELGFALHPVMDSTSPPHQDFTEWDLSDFYKHGPCPASEETDSLSDLTPNLLAQTISRMQSSTQGGEIDCSCYT